MTTSRPPTTQTTLLPTLLLATVLQSALAGTLFAQATASPDEVSGEIEEYVGIGGEDPSFVMPVAPLEGAMGFSKSLVDTPRSVSVISSDLIDRIGVRDGDQLSRIVPGTYTVNRWGIAGATQVRGLPADTYLRGMKRIDAQGNIRNVITMWENVEIVRGPPSPIFGNGRIGGYTNYTPKSVRGTTGRYLESSQTSVSALLASYDRVEMQFNHAQPLQFGELDGGFQVFGLVNDSESYFKHNFQRDRVLQASMAINLSDKWRLETGGIYQRAINAGQAGANRVDQRSFNDGTYLRGSALVNLDLDGDGLVSEYEIQASRSYTGFTGARPLSLTLGSIDQLRGPNSIVGAPQTLIDLLQRPEYASVAGSAEGQAILAAGPLRYVDGSAADSLLNNLNNVPVGFFLNPAELQHVERDWSLVAIEEKADGFTGTAYLDFLSDSDPNRTQKLQFFFDTQHQLKESQLPFNQDQDISVFETKYTLTRHAETLPVLSNLPDWASLNLLGSVNARHTNGKRRATSGDYDHRRDLVRGYTPTDTFTSFIRTGDESFATGEPISSHVHSRYWELGVGLLIDLTLWERLGITGGARADWIDAKTFEGAQFARFAASSATGTINPARGEIAGNDDAVSRSISVNYKTPWLGFTPYYTAAVSSSALVGTFMEIGYNNVRDSLILSEATLHEAGFKGAFNDNRVFYSVSYFDQTRGGNVIQEGESYNRSTRNEGVEVEVRWLPNRSWSFILGVTNLEMTRVKLDPSQTRNAAATANYFGIADITDANGNIIVPANAFLYGGNASVSIPNSDLRYERFGQYPEWVIGGFIGYNFNNGFSLSWSGNWVDSVAASSELPDLLILPDYLTHNVTLAYDNQTWRVALQIRNVTDEEYFVPNNGSFGGMLLQPGLPTNWEFSVTRRF